MEELTRMVADSLARHGFAAALDHRRLEWSRWFRCESSFSLLLVPSAAGIYALGEEVIAPGELPSASGKRLLAVFQVSETEDLCVALSRLFAPRNPLSARLSSGRCFVRFTLVADQHERMSACESLNQWLTSSTEIATGLAPTTACSMPPAAEQAETSRVAISAEAQAETSRAAMSAEAQAETRRVAMSAEAQAETSRIATSAETSRTATSAVSPGRKSGETSEKLPRVPSGTTPNGSVQQLAPVGSAKDTECEPPPLPAGF